MNNPNITKITPLTTPDQPAIKTPAADVSANQQQNQKIEDKPQGPVNPPAKVEVPAQPSPAQKV